MLRLLLLASLAALPLSARAADVAFDFDDPAFTDEEKTLLRSVLDPGDSELRSDGTVIEGDGSLLTIEEARANIAWAREEDRRYSARRRRERDTRDPVLTTLRSLAAGGWGRRGSAEDPVVETSHRHRPRMNPGGPVSPERRRDPRWWLGNDEDRMPPENYRPGDPDRVRNWYYRNPLHNATRYTIGLSDRDYDVIGTHPEGIRSGEGFDWAVSEHGGAYYPFISYARNFGNRRFNFYLGWRPSGAFGAKLNLVERRPG